MNFTIPFNLTREDAVVLVRYYRNLNLLEWPQRIEELIWAFNLTEDEIKDAR